MSRHRHKRVEQQHSCTPNHWSVISALCAAGRFLMEGAHALQDGTVAHVWRQICE